ncbi:MAG: Kiwa anti-phage protein KwaB-like domain-containing protein [Paraburkholderia sp.]|uniref:Kiwa anti-phage protein KwaB-like domain-containing protein n=1 Tax=Paraburkholderia sp. TaxID=1926495 RepID=UPI003C48C079
MNLFALTRHPAARIVRFPLTADLQNQIEEVFNAQLQAFETDIVETIPFDGRYVPDEGELLVIEEFEDVDGLADAAANPFGIDMFDPATHSLESVKALFVSVRRNDADCVLIQNFERRRLIANKGLAMFFSGNTFHKMSDEGLTLDTRLLAVLEGGSLRFQSFHFLRRIFDLTEYYREATNDEVATFATHQKLSVDDLPNFLAAAGPLIRKKISLISQSGILDNYTTAQIVASAQSFNVVIAVGDDGRIKLPANKTELRRLLRFLDEDYYESPLSQTRFLSNSKRVAD